MPLDTCITNVGEYYSSHYLDSTFSKDVKDLVKGWNEQGSTAPPRRLQNLSQTYFRAKTQVLDEEDPAARSEAGEEARGWNAQLLHALGYTDLQPLDHATEGGDTFVPTLGRVNRYNQPWLVVCETFFCLPDASLKEGMPSEDPLEMIPEADQLLDQAEHKLCEGDWSRCLGRLFTEEDAPRWILFLAGSQILLLDRNTFAQGRYLSFDLDDAFGRKEKETLNHIAAFLSADTLCPDGESDEVLLDKLEEQSHRFAHGVTESLQFAVREAIELLVNEWARDRTEREKRPLLKISKDELKSRSQVLRNRLPELDDRNYEITAEHLRREALTFVYRLLFCFYAESRGGEVEILPVDDDIYRLGYGLESLRDLELVPLTDVTGEGTYFHQHLKKLFGIIHNGFHPNESADDSAQSRILFNGDTVRAFQVRPLTATLFSPDSTPLLNRAEMSNRCLQQVIRKLSLSTDKNSRTVGRVNYAELGINQLGAVYEGLLSYKGMFADQELIHVKPASKSFGDKKTPTWFVPKERLEEFKKDEVERLDDGKPRIYRKGEFILHLNGIDREQSASYYTPEVLTKCLVEEALRELLKDYTPDDADKILSLKICEPAMGSGAFLNEAAEQLATRYLELKQKQLQNKYPDGQVPLSDLRIVHADVPASRVSQEVIENEAVGVMGAVPEADTSSSIASTTLTLEKSLDEDGGSVSTTIEPAHFGDELRRVKHYIATNNIYGVDLNETAVELGQLSLWLGSIHRLLVKEGENGGRDVYQSGATPWFGLRLRCGNSLIGARRAVWTTDQLKRGEHAWSSKQIQQVQSDIEQLKEHTNPDEFAKFDKSTLDLITKIKWDELADDHQQCREQLVRFCESTRERNSDGLTLEERKLYEKRQSTWKWIHNQHDQDQLLALFDLLPEGRIREANRVSFEIFKTLESQHSEFKAGLPRLLKPGESRNENEIYHFLVFDPDMVPTRSDKLMRSYWKEDCDKAGEWIKEQVSSKWSKDNLRESAEICDLIDQHWSEYAKQRTSALNATACTATVWPVTANSPEALNPGPTLEDQERICRELESSSGSFQRLQLVMDTWCSFWFWPLNQVSELPSRDAFLASVRLLLSGDPPDKSGIEMLTVRLGFEVEVLLKAAPEGKVPDTALMARGVPWFGIAETIRHEQRFHHWELTFVEVFGIESSGGGFDLIVGNPPWIKAEWPEAAVLAEFEPKLGVREAKSAQVTRSRTQILGEHLVRFKYGTQYTVSNGAVAYLSAPRLFPELEKLQTNLYKNFIVTAWRIGRRNCVSALLHPEGPFDEAKGGRFRQEIYPRLRAHYHIINELHLFTDVDHHTEYSINIYGPINNNVGFRLIANLFHPRTILTCVGDATGSSPIPGIKSDDNDWETRGHRDRIVFVTNQQLQLFCKLLEEGPNVSHLASRLPKVHSVQIERVLAKVVNTPSRLSDLRDDVFISQMLHEANSQANGLTTRYDDPTFQPLTERDWILSGPHFFVATPFNRTPRSKCDHNNAYDDIDLLELTSDYLPRSLYSPGNSNGDRIDYESSLPSPNNGIQVIDSFRHVHREMISLTTERSLIPAIIPPGTNHIHTVLSVTFRDEAKMVLFNGCCSSICYDFLIKAEGKGHCGNAGISKLPFLENIEIGNRIVSRCLRLNCLTQAYSRLWAAAAPDDIADDGWTSSDVKLRSSIEQHWSGLSGEWSTNSPLRTDFSRRQALIEIDVLVALALGLSLEDLLTVFRVQFPVMRWYEKWDRYDAHGRRVPAIQGPSKTRKIHGSREFREVEATREVGDESPMSVTWEINNGLEAKTVEFQPPFAKVDREADYARTWEEFEKRYGRGGSG